MKKMNVFIGAGLLVLGLASCGGNSNTQGEGNEGAAVTEETVVAETTEVSINTQASEIKWKGTMLGAYEHFGTLAISQGNLVMAGNSITGGSFTVDLKSMVPTDENYSEENPKEHLVGHLSSPDFFDVPNFPTATFEITGSDAEGNVMGNLTLRGKTNPETVKNVSMDEASGKMMGTMTFNRQNYGVSWASTAKDMVLSDDIELNITLVKE